MCGPRSIRDKQRLCLATEAPRNTWDTRRGSRLGVAGFQPTARFSCMRTVNRIVAVALLGLALTGCTQLPNLDEGVVTYDASSGAGNAAAFSGILVFENGCVRFENGTIPLFPKEETSWDGKNLVLNGVTYQMGDTIDVGGGEATRDDSTAHVPDRCGDGPLWVVAPS